MIQKDFQRIKRFKITWFSILQYRFFWFLQNVQEYRKLIRSSPNKVTYSLLKTFKCDVAVTYVL